MGIIGSAMGRPVAKGAGRKARARSGVRGRADAPGRAPLLPTLLSRLDNVGVLVSDHAGKIVTANPAWWTLLGLPRRYSPGKGVTVAFPPVLLSPGGSPSAH